MRRFWFEFEARLVPFEDQDAHVDGTGPPERSGTRGIGVTGQDEGDCLGIVKAKIFNGLAIPPVSRVVPDVDISTLGEPVLSNMEPPIWRGIWFPLGYADPPTT
jgi:hypothetical protein